MVKGHGQPLALVGLGCLVCQMLSQAAPQILLSIPKSRELSNQRSSPPWAVEPALSWHRSLTGNFSPWWECSPISRRNTDGVTPKCQAGYRGYSVLCELEATSPLKTQSHILKHIYGPKNFQIRCCRPGVSHARYPARGLPWGLLHAHL